MKPSIPFLASLASYAVSLALPAVHGRGHSLDGFALLLLGWVQAPVECAAWLANLTFFSAVLLFLIRSYRASLCLAVGSVAIGFDTFRATRFSIDSGGFNIPIESIGAAFYVWQVSFILLAIASYRRTSANPPVPPPSIRQSA